MSSWVYLVADVGDPEGFLDGVRAALGESRLVVDRREPREDAPGRVRLAFTTEFDAPPDAPPSGTRPDRYVAGLVEDGAFGDLAWAVVGRGNDTADAGRVYVFEGTERIDEFHGNEGRLGHDAAAYLERYHGVLVDPTPEVYGEWRHADVYDPTYDLPEEPPGRTLADEPPDPPFEYAGHDRWTLLVGAPSGDGPDPVAAVRESVAPAGIPVTEEPSTAGPSDRVRLSVPETLVGRTPASEAFDDRLRYDGYGLRWAVLLAGDPATGAVRASVYADGDVIDEVEGAPGADGRDVATYLADAHGIALDPAPEGVPGSLPAPGEVDPVEGRPATSLAETSVGPTYDTAVELCRAAGAPFDPPLAALVEAGNDALGDAFGGLSVEDGAAHARVATPVDPEPLLNAAAIALDVAPAAYDPGVAQVLVYAPDTGGARGVTVLFGDGTVVAVGDDPGTARERLNELVAELATVPGVEVRDGVTALERPVTAGRVGEIIAEGSGDS